MRVFHGTRHASRISSEGFLPSSTGEFGPGIYFTTFEPTAWFYARRVASGPEDPAVLHCEVVLEKPFHTTKADYTRLTLRSTPRAVQARLVRQGYDGIVGVGLNGVDVQVVAFHPTQVRACDAGGRSSGRTRFTPPPAVRANAQEGLRLVGEGYAGRGLTDGAKSRARSLARGVPIDLERARMMRAWFARHAVDARPGWRERRTPGWVAWQIWGGTAARHWVEAIVRRSP